MKMTMRPIAHLPNTTDTGFTVDYTADLGIFNGIEANRDIVEGHVDMLSRTMGKYVLYSPIYVNDDMEVLDGQHRLAALARRNTNHNAGLGTHYIQFKGMGFNASTIPVYNTNAVNWKTEHYIDAYCSKGDDNYRRLRSFINYANNQLGAGGAAKVPSNTPFSAGLAMILLVGKDDLTPLKKGVLRVSQEQVLAASRIFDALIDLKNGNVKVWKQKKFIVAFSQFVGKTYNRAKMQKQLIKWDGAEYLTTQRTVDDYRKKITEFYNA